MTLGERQEIRIDVGVNAFLELVKRIRKALLIFRPELPFINTNHKPKFNYENISLLYMKKADSVCTTIDSIPLRLPKNGF